jgi:hypothetical protein
MTQIGSPLLHAEVVGPALLAASRTGWDVVQRQYLDALRHQRRSAEGPDALIAANSAVESALKAMGMKGNTLGDLMKSLRNSNLLPGTDLGTLKHLVDLSTALMAWRSGGGKAHGVASGSPVPTDALVALAIHWAGAMIVFLAEVARDQEMPA